MSDDNLSEYTDEELAQELAERHHSNESRDIIKIEVHDGVRGLGDYAIYFNTIRMESTVWEESGMHNGGGEARDDR